MFLAHWDTRNLQIKMKILILEKPVLGANDGASGVSVLMTLAEMLLIIHQSTLV